MRVRARALQQEAPRTTLLHILEAKFGLSSRSAHAQIGDQEDQVKTNVQVGGTDHEMWLA